MGDPDCWLVQQTGSGLNRVSELESGRVSVASSVQTLLTVLPFEFGLQKETRKTGPEDPAEN